MAVKPKIVLVQGGKGFFGDVWKGIKKVGGFVKDNGLLSKGLALTGNPMLSSGAKMLGLGKKKGKRKGKKGQGGKGKKGKKSLIS